MALINIQELTIGYGRVPLLDRVTIQVHDGERICLLGRNGAGKSTFLRIINGDITPDSGAVVLTKGVRTALLPQDVPVGLRGSVRDVVAQGLAESLALGRNPDDESSDGDHDPERFVKKALSLIGVDPDAKCEDLSAGLVRRVLFGRAIAPNPDVLLLDEPTNHLDIDTVRWLEDVILRYNKAVLFVTHDRAFLQRVADRIVELDRGKLFDWRCDYATFIERKDSWLLAEEARNADFDRKLAEEEVWIRRGVKARRTRNEGRVKALLRMREERARRRELKGSVRMEIHAARNSGDIVIEAKGVSFGYDERPLITDFSTVVERGDRVGIIGPNGCGKSTLVRLLLGQSAPNTGSVRTGSRIECVYFDQLRNTLDGSRSVRENVCGDGDYIEINGKRRHVIGYLGDFLFSRSAADLAVNALSGGEKNRLLLAKLFARPSNLIVMDEPTNDLDIETIELLEELLIDYSGTLLVVSHDRTFLNNVVTSILSFESGGTVGEYAGGFDDWLIQRKIVPESEREKKESARPKRDNVKRKLSFKEKNEYESIPALIESKEKRKDELFALMADPGFYKQPGERIVETRAELAVIERDLDALFARWAELDAIHSS